MQVVRRAIGTPIEKFLRIEAASGLLLLAAAATALVWANSPWADSYDALWRIEIGFDVGGVGLRNTLHWWVNDGLMTIFFFVVGLEIKREIMEGELASARRASLPLAAALGGMLAPALIFVAVTEGSSATRGWGIPMATDIAFAVGVLSLLGKRVPPALRVLLLALAIVDDVGAILVIAVSYSSGLNLEAIWTLVGALVLLFVMRKFGVRQVPLYFVPGIALWIGVHEFGVHAAIAGVALGLLTPHASWFGKERFLAVADSATAEFRARAEVAHRDEDLMRPLSRLAVAQREALSPIARLQNGFHGYVAYGIMPLFALANAGVALGGVDLGNETVFQAGLGVAVALVVGKPLGVVAGSWIAVRAGVSALPLGVNWRGILVVGMVAGIGFTMAIFIAGLAFPPIQGVESLYHPVAKLAVLVGSGVAAAVGLALGLVLLRREFHPGAAQTATEAERATTI